jgi:hypothetical protein
MAESTARLAHMQALLDFPDPRWHWMYHRYLQILLQRPDDIERCTSPILACRSHRPLAPEEALLDVGVDLFGGSSCTLSNGVDAVDRLHIEAGAAHVRQRWR